MAIVGPLPNQIKNGQIIDAVPVMNDFNWLKDQVNTNVPIAITAASATGKIFSTYVPAANVSGSANAIALTPSPVITSYQQGQGFRFPAIATNTSSVTIATSGLAVRALSTTHGTALIGGELVTGGMYDIVDNGTNYVLLGLQGQTSMLSFTPTVSFGGASVGVTYAFQVGNYRLVGGMVFFSLDVLLSSKGSSTGALRIGGLPYAINAAWPTAGFNAGPVSLVRVNFSGGTPGYCIFNYIPGSTTLGIFDIATSSVLQNITEGSVVNNSEIACSGFYPI